MQSYVKKESKSIFACCLRPIALVARLLSLRILVENCLDWRSRFALLRLSLGLLGRERKHCLKCDWLRYARLSLRRLGNICLPERDWLLRRHASASLNAFPLESSAMCNKKAVLFTAFFVIIATICEQAPIVVLITKATRKSGFLVAHCA